MQRTPSAPLMRKPLGLGMYVRSASAMLALTAVSVVTGACYEQPTSAELAQVESVMLPGMAITATTPVGTITVHAESNLRRSYAFANTKLSTTMTPRTERWYGSLGLYDGGASLWCSHGRIDRTVVEEGQQHFETAEEALEWIRSQRAMPYVYRNDGLAVGWKTFAPRCELDVEVWQLLVQGNKPKRLEGAEDDKIRVTESPEP
jgi:hypothetical protein